MVAGNPSADLNRMPYLLFLYEKISIANRIITYSVPQTILKDYILPVDLAIAL